MWKMQDLNKSEIGRSTISEKVRNPKKVGNQLTVGNWKKKDI